MNTIRKFKRTAAVVIISLILLTVTAITALADAPGNDNYADATVITTFPFTDSQNLTEATTEPGDPWTCGGNVNSIWYRYTPDNDSGIRISVGAEYYATLAIYRLDNDVLTSIDCRVYDHFSTNINVTSGKTYYFELLDQGNINLEINQFTLPENDDDEKAKAVTEIPFSESVDTTYATTQANEPTGCALGVQRSIWYSVTPTTSGLYTAGLSGFKTALAIYTGSDLNSLQDIACALGEDPYTAQITVWLDAGTTYYFQSFPSYW
jgi:hypothetical protein